MNEPYIGNTAVPQDLHFSCQFSSFRIGFSRVGKLADGVGSKLLAPGKLGILQRLLM